MEIHMIIWKSIDNMIDQIDNMLILHIIHMIHTYDPYMTYIVPYIDNSIYTYIHFYNTIIWCTIIYYYIHYLYITISIYCYHPINHRNPLAKPAAKPATTRPGLWPARWWAASRGPGRPNLAMADGASVGVTWYNPKGILRECILYIYICIYIYIYVYIYMMIR